MGVHHEADQLLGLDAVLPEQFQGLWSQSTFRRPEERLALAVLLRAADDVQRTRGVRRPSKRRLHAEACEWFCSDDRQEPFAFLNVCDVLGLPEDLLRARILVGAPVRLSRIRRAA